VTLLNRDVTLSGDVSFANVYFVLKCFSKVDFFLSIIKVMTLLES